MVSSAEDTEVEEAQSPGRREVTIVEDSQSSTIKFTRKLDRSLVPKSELPSKSPIKGDKEKKNLGGQNPRTRRHHQEDPGARHQGGSQFKEGEGHGKDEENHQRRVNQLTRV